MKNLNIFSSQTYLEHCIENESSLNDNKTKIGNLKKMLKDYSEILNIFESNKNQTLIDCDEVFSSIKRLYELKNYGTKIKEMKEKQERVRDAEFKLVANETTYNPLISLLEEYKNEPRVQVEEQHQEQNTFTSIFSKIFK